MLSCSWRRAGSSSATRASASGACALAGSSPICSGSDGDNPATSGPWTKFIRIRGQPYYLWRAVDQDGNVLDILVQSRRSATAAKRLFRKLLSDTFRG